MKLSPRDALVLSLTRDKLVASKGNYFEAVAALRAAVEACIPDGRVYVLQKPDEGLVLGSLVSGLGLLRTRDDRALVVQVQLYPTRSVLVHEALLSC